MNDTSIVIPRLGDQIMFADCELKIRNTPNLILNSMSKTPGYVLSFKFSLDDILTDYPDFEETFTLLGNDYSDIYPKKVFYSKTRAVASGIQGYLVINEFTVKTHAFSITSEPFDVFGAVSLTYTSSDMILVTFSGGILDLPSIEKSPNVQFQRLAAPQKPKFASKHEKYTKFEILDL